MSSPRYDAKSRLKSRFAVIPTMRIALLTPAIAAVGRLSGPPWRAHARRHGYDFLPSTARPTRPATRTGGKVRLLLDHLDGGRYDWLFASWFGRLQAVWKDSNAG
jgi:hypothetical protein